MITFFSAVILLLLGYFIYAKALEKLVGINPNKITPAFAMRDNLDYTPISKPRNALINLINITGTGPIFGPILAALYGPVALLWIVFGCIFAGGVHDFLIGVISLRNKGATLPSLAEKYMFKFAKHLVNIFSILLLLLVATVFVMAPANLIFELFKSTEGLHNIFKILSKIDLIYIVAAIFVYNFLTTLLPVDKVLGKIYPYFGALLIFTAAAILFSVLFLFPELPKPELNLRNMHPEGMPIFPLLFLVLSCGAISGFHATQIPIVSRTLENEGHARTVFYGMMIGEGIIALIWAFATLTLLDGNTLLALIEQGTPSLVVSEIAITTLGAVLGTIAIVGVISLPLTSGATAFRAIRLMLAEYCRINQTAKIRRILITIPAFILSMILCTINFQMLWQYFSWANQILATLTLWICTIYLVKIGKPCYYAFLPALFMSFVVITYIIYSPIGFNLNIDVSKVAGFLITLCIAIAFLLGKKRIVKENIE